MNYLILFIIRHQQRVTVVVLQSIFEEELVRRVD